MNLPPIGWLELPNEYALFVYSSLAKGAGHKHWKKVPTGKFRMKRDGSQGAQIYRYFYKPTSSGASSAHHEDHFVVGASFQANGGHWHIKSVNGDKLTISHDESGDSKTLSKKDLANMLHEEHKAAIEKHRAESEKRAAAEKEEVAKYGTEKQKKRAGVEPKPEPKVDVKVESKPFNPSGKTAQDIYESTGLQEVAKALRDRVATPEMLKDAAQRLVDNKDAIQAALSKLTKAELDKLAQSPWSLSSHDKLSLIRLAYAQLFDHLMVHQSYTSSMGEDSVSARLRAINKTTDQDVADFYARIDKSKDEHKARVARLANPQTLADFKELLRAGGRLTSDQRKAYDELVAHDARDEAQRDHERAHAEKREYARKRASLTGSALASETTAKVIPGKHTKHGHDIWTVQLADRLESDEYSKVNAHAKSLGGYYSSFRGNGAIPGFVFKDAAAAQSFANKFGGVGGDSSIPKVDANIADVEEPIGPLHGSGPSRLREQADSIHAKAQETLDADRKTNTARRADMASGIESRARGEQKFAKDMRSIADAVESGEAKHLWGVKTKAHVELLNSVLREAKYNALRKRRESGEDFKNTEWERQPSADDIDYAKFPDPSVHKDTARNLAVGLKDAPGAKMAAQRVLKRLQVLGDNDHRLTATTEQERDDLKSLVEIAKRRGIAKYDADAVANELTEHKRAVEGMGIKSLPQLRAALREYHALSSGNKREDMDPIKRAERDLIGFKIPGYFPTPKGLVDRMVSLAEIKPGEKVLEPSAGKGSIADAVKDAGAMVSTIEPSDRLRTVLESKGHEIVGRDALEHGEKYDKVVMNPPFEGGQDIDHVRHAFDNNLKAGGKLVAIMSEGPFFRSDKKSREFREWLESNGGTSERNPEGAFKSSDNPTGVATRTVVIEKPINLSKGTPMITWIPLTQSFGEAIWAASLNKAAIPADSRDGSQVVRLPYFIAKAFVGPMLAKAGGSYTKRVPTGKYRMKKDGSQGAMIYRYFYGTPHHMTSHEDMKAGTSYKHADGDLTIHGVKDGKLQVSHSKKPGKIEHITHDELASRLSAQHGGAIAAEKEKLTKRLHQDLADAKEYGSAKHVERILNEMKARGVEPPKTPEATKIVPTEALPKAWEEWGDRPRGKAVDFTGHPWAGELSKIGKDRFGVIVTKKDGETRGRGDDKKTYGDAKVQVSGVFGFDYGQMVQDSKTGLEKIDPAKVAAKSNAKGWVRDPATKKLVQVDVTEEDFKQAYAELADSIQKSIDREHDKETGLRPLEIDGKKLPGIKVYRGGDDAYTGSPQNKPKPDTIYVSCMKINSIELEPPPNGYHDAQSAPKTVAKDILTKMLPLGHYRNYKLRRGGDWTIRVDGLDLKAEDVERALSLMKGTRKMYKAEQWESDDTGFDPLDPFSTVGTIEGGIIELPSTKSLVKAGFTWVPMSESFGEKVWSTSLNKAAIPANALDGSQTIELPYFVAKAFLGPTLAKAGGAYSKRVPTGKFRVKKDGSQGGMIYRYFYGVHHGSGIHNKEHFVEGASFAHGKGHMTIHGVKDGKIHVKHADGKEEHLTHDELSSKLEAHHKDALDKHKEKLTKEHAEALESGNEKGAKRIRDEAAKIGHKIGEPKAKKAPKAVSAPAKPKAEPAKLAATPAEKPAARNVAEPKPKAEAPKVEPKAQTKEQHELERLATRDLKRDTITKLHKMAQEFAEHSNNEKDALNRLDEALSALSPKDAKSMRDEIQGNNGMSSRSDELRQRLRKLEDREARGGTGQYPKSNAMLAVLNHNIALEMQRHATRNLHPSNADAWSALADHVQKGDRLHPETLLPDYAHRAHMKVREELGLDVKPENKPDVEPKAQPSAPKPEPKAAESKSEPKAPDNKPSHETHVAEAKSRYNLKGREAERFEAHEHVKKSKEFREAGDHAKADRYLREAVKETLYKTPERNMSPSSADKYMKEREKKQLEKALGIVASLLKAGPEDITYNKPRRIREDEPGYGVKKFVVHAKASDGRTRVIRFGDAEMEIKRDDPVRRKNFRARHNCDEGETDILSAKYWSCRQWRSGAKVED